MGAGETWGTGRDCLLAQRGRPWLGDKSDRFWQRFDQRCRDLEEALGGQETLTVVLALADPVEILAAVAAIALYPVQGWLGNPTWGEQEWHQALAQVGPGTRLWGTLPAGVVLAPQGQPPAILPEHLPCWWIPTGGSSGQIRFAAHHWQTWMAAVDGFCRGVVEPLGLGAVHSYGVLPLYHVSGLMQAVRAWATGGELWIQSFRDLQGGEPLPGSAAFLSLVPTQLARLLAQPQRIAWLRRHRCILLGGAPPWPALLTQARQARLPLAPTYGMTETAGQVATLLPDAFLAGEDSCGPALPHCTLSLSPDTGLDSPGPPSPTAANVPGLITLATPALALTYSDRPLPRPFQPGDWGMLTPGGRVQVLGRGDTLIHTGGEKVQPEEVEAVLMATGCLVDGAVVGVPDGDWGQELAALIIPHHPHDPALLPHLRAALRAHLSPYKHPKRWYLTTALPRNAQGKLRRGELLSWLHQAQPLG